jgi:hypothetical protein
VGYYDGAWTTDRRRAAERLAKAIWYDTAEPIRTIPASPLADVQYPYCWRPYTLRDGSLRRVQVRVHPDPRVQAVVEQIREAEMVQGIDRLRLIHSVREKTVFILCNIPLDIPIDRLVTWRQLAGDSRLADALAACEENGWKALSLAAAKLSELFPELWPTARAVEGWLRKNPLNPSISIIRLWGVLVDYKPRRQRRWSRALVRDGANAGPAIGDVLGLSAEDLVMRDRA